MGFGHASPSASLGSRFLIQWFTIHIGQSDREAIPRTRIVESRIAQQDGTIIGAFCKGRAFFVAAASCRGRRFVVQTEDALVQVKALQKHYAENVPQTLRKQHPVCHIHAFNEKTLIPTQSQGIANQRFTATPQTSPVASPQRQVNIGYSHPLSAHPVRIEDFSPTRIQPVHDPSYHQANSVPISNFTSSHHDSSLSPSDVVKILLNPKAPVTETPAESFLIEILGKAALQAVLDLCKPVSH